MKSVMMDARSRAGARESGRRFESPRGEDHERAAPRAVGVTDSAVEVTVVVDERDAWRTLVFARGTSESQKAEKERLVRAMFATTN